MKKLLACSLISTVLLGGCDPTKQLPREVVIVPDVSASIDPESRRQMFAAIEDVAQHLQRGDTLTIIPITGNAEAELPGRTLHYAVPPAEDRQAYDADLRKLNAKIKDDLARLQADAIAHPGKYSDILGSIRVAMREFSNKPTDKRLVVLSDFIQEDRQFNFRRDPRLASERSSAKLGHDVLQQLSPHPTVSVILARLRSSEFSSLPVGRQKAINAFWGQVMSPSEVRPDGTTNLSATLLEEKR
jgi:hypothetical protein